MKVLKHHVLNVERRTKKGHYLLVTPTKTYVMPIEFFKITLTNN
jgi:hypothetical protein